jgi:hypothetical protein
VPKTLTTALALALCLALAWSGRAAPPPRLTHQGLEAARIRWLPADTVWSTPEVLQNRRQQLLDPGRHAQLMNELKTMPKLAGPQVRKAMYHTLLSTMRSDLPAAQRATICQQLSRQFGKLAREVRQVPGMPVSERVAFGRVLVRFLRDDVLVQEFAREREQQYQLAKAIPKTSLGVKRPPSNQSSTTPPKIEWQIPAPVDKSALKSGEVKALTYSVSGYKQNTVEALERYERQARRWRLVQSHTFSPRFVQKQKKALDSATRHLEAETRRMVHSVPRLTEAKLLKAFVWPESPVKLERIVRNPRAVQVVDKSPLWTVNDTGLELRRTPGGLKLQATFETTIKNDAVLRAVKQSIETVWNGPIRVKGVDNQRLQTSVTFHKVAREADFNQGSLRLVEGRSNCATQGTIELSRCFAGTTPAHEFGHILGLRDTYKALYDPRARTFVEVQDHATLMGTDNAPATCNTMTAACRNLLQRQKSAAPGN